MQTILRQRKTSLSGISALLMFFVATICILGNPSASSEGALEGLKICSSVVIPALFPFTVASIFFQKSGGLYWFGNKIQKLSKAIFGMDGKLFSVMILSLTGGYPVAAKIINDMAKEGYINETEAKKAIRFSINASPAFFISVVGADILKSKTAGILLLVANTIACIILNITTFRIKTSATSANCKKTKNRPKQSLSDAFVLSVTDGCSVLLNICAWVILFSAVTGILKNALKQNVFYSFVCPFLEITVGCIEISKIGLKPQLFSALLAFGGLSTLCQIKVVIQNIKYTFTDLIISRILHGSVATVISLILFKLFPPTLDAISNSAKIIFNGFPLKLSSIVLGLTAIVFLVYIKPQKKPNFD